MKNLRGQHVQRSLAGEFVAHLTVGQRNALRLIVLSPVNLEQLRLALGLPYSPQVTYNKSGRVFVPVNEPTPTVFDIVLPKPKKENFGYRTKSKAAGEEGFALLFAIFTLALLLILGVGLLYMTDSETMINANYRNNTQAYFGAIAGLQSVRERLTVTNTGTHRITPPTALPGNPNSILYVLASGATPLAVGSADYDQQLCTEFPRVSGASCPAAGSSQFMPSVTDDTGVMLGNANFTSLFRWVRIERKVNGTNAPYRTEGTLQSDTTPICWDGYHERACSATVTMPVYTLTAFAHFRNSQNVMQMEVAAPVTTITRGAMDTQDYETLNGNLGMNGYNWCNSADATHYGLFSSGNVYLMSEIVTAPTNPALAQDQTWPWDLNTVVQNLSTSPGVVNVPSGTWSSATFGTPPSFPPPTSGTVGGTAQTTYVNGDLTLTGNSQGNGTLVVNGNLFVNGGLQFYGQIITTGAVVFENSGSSLVQVYGGILSAQFLNDSNNIGASSNNIRFDSCAFAGATTLVPTALGVRNINF